MTPIDAHARCFPEELISAYLSHAGPVPPTHKRCRSSLQSVVLNVRALEEVVSARAVAAAHDMTVKPCAHP